VCHPHRTASTAIPPEPGTVARRRRPVVDLISSAMITSTAAVVSAQIVAGEIFVAIRRIVKYGDPVLGTPTRQVINIDDDIRTLVQDMVATMYAAPGVGLAANQVGVSLRVAVIDVTAGQEKGNLIVLINPQVIEQEGKQIEEEGCLSIPGFTEFLARPARAVIRALDLEGREFTLEGHELLARAFCHETDHLDGRLFIDRLGGIKRQMITKKVRKAADADEWSDVYP